MGLARRRIGPVIFAGVRKDQRPAPFRIEACSRLERHEGDSRVRDRTRPACAREVLAPLAGGEGLARAVGDLGNRDRVIAVEKSIAVVAARWAVIVVDDPGIEAGGVPTPDRANLV